MTIARADTATINANANINRSRIERGGFEIAQAARQPEVRVNIMELGIAPKLPQNPPARAVRALADGVGDVVGKIFNIPEGTPLKDASPTVGLFALRGMQVDAQGNVNIPNTREGGAMLVEIMREAHSPGDLAFTAGLHGISQFKNSDVLQRAGFGPEFIEGFNQRANNALLAAGITTGLALANTAAGSVSAAKNQTFMNSRIPTGSTPQKQPVNLARDGKPAIDLQPNGRGGHAMPTQGKVMTGQAAGQGSGSLVSAGASPLIKPSPVPSGAVPAIARPPGPPPSTGMVAPRQPTVSGGEIRPSSIAPQTVKGPGDDGSIARHRAEVDLQSAKAERQLNERFAAHPIPTVGNATVSSGPFNWAEAGQAVKAHNAKGDQLDLVIRVPVHRDLGDAKRHDVGIVRGDAFAITGQVKAMQNSGLVPTDFDLVGAARQSGIADWPGAIDAAAAQRAPAIAAENPIQLNGGRTYLVADAQGEALRFNGESTGADKVAVALDIHRKVSDAGLSGNATTREVYVGDPATLGNTLDTMRQQGLIGRDTTNAQILAEAGISGSIGSRATASRDLRAAEIEAGHPTTLFGRSVTATASAGDAQRLAVAQNASPADGDMALAVPLLRDLSGPGLASGARGTAHVVYAGPPETLRGFFDTMEKQGRIPAGTTFDSALENSGIAGRFKAVEAEASEVGGLEAELSPTRSMGPSRQMKAIQDLERSLSSLKTLGHPYTEIDIGDMIPIFPEGGHIPQQFAALRVEMTRFFGPEGTKDFLSLVKNHPEEMFALSSAHDIRFLPGPDGVKLRSPESGEGIAIAEMVQNLAATKSGPDARLQAWLEVAELVKPAFPRAVKVGEFQVSRGIRVDPETKKTSSDVTVTHKDDHNGALRKKSIGGRENIGLLPNHVLLPEWLGSSLLIETHGHPTGMSPNNAAVLKVAFGEIRRAAQEGRPIENVVLGSCSQRDPRTFGMGSSNGYLFAKDLNNMIASAGLPPVNVYAAADSGLLSGPFTSLMITDKKGERRPTHLAPVSAPSTQEMTAALARTIGAASLAGLGVSGASVIGARVLVDQLAPPLPQSSLTRTRPEQAALSSESERFQQLDAAFAKAATPSDRTEARDELVNFSRELVAIARDPKLGKLGNDPAASKEMVNSLIDTMSDRYGLDAMRFIGPGGNIDAFPDALAEKLDAGR